jgi:hypothetical protein
VNFGRPLLSALVSAAALSSVSKFVPYLGMPYLGVGASATLFLLFMIIATFVTVGDENEQDLFWYDTYLKPLFMPYFCGSVVLYIK